jgi:hypothetical protein
MCRLRTDFTDKELPEQKDRKFVFDFIEQEILDNVDALQEQPTTQYYGRGDQREWPTHSWLNST